MKLVLHHLDSLLRRATGPCPPDWKDADFDAFSDDFIGWLTTYSVASVPPPEEGDFLCGDPQSGVEYWFTQGASIIGVCPRDDDEDVEPQRYFRIPYAAAVIQIATRGIAVPSWQRYASSCNHHNQTRSTPPMSAPSTTLPNGWTAGTDASGNPTAIAPNGTDIATGQVYEYITTVVAMLAQLQQENTDLTATVKQLTDEVAQLKGIPADDDTSEDQGISSLRADLTTLQGVASTMQAALDALTAKVDAIPTPATDDDTSADANIALLQTTVATLVSEFAAMQITQAGETTAVIAQLVADLQATPLAPPPTSTTGSAGSTGSTDSTSTTGTTDPSLPGSAATPPPTA